MLKTLFKIRKSCLRRRVNKCSREEGECANYEKGDKQFFAMKGKDITLLEYCQAFPARQSDKEQCESEHVTMVRSNGFRQGLRYFDFIN